MDSLFAFVDWTEIGGLAIGFGMFVIMPVVWLMLSHQRKMAELFHRNNPQPDPQVQQLEREVQELRQRINHLILVVDEKHALQERTGPPKMPTNQG